MAGGLAVVLSGGGAKGAFQVGVLHELMVRRGIDFDQFHGVSTGSIQAAAGAMGRVDELLAQWQAIRGNDDVYLRRFPGLLTRLSSLFSPGKLTAAFDGLQSRYDATPLRRRLAEFIVDERVRATGKTLRIGVVCLQTGDYVAVGENNPGLADWVYASCAEPTLYAPLDIRINGEVTQWVDGGVRNITPIGQALALDPRAILVVRASPQPFVQESTQYYPDLVRIGLRASDIVVSEASNDDYRAGQIAGDLHTRCANLEAYLRARGLPEPAIAEAIMLMTARPPVNVRFLEPRLNRPAQTYDPTSIAEMIAEGRQAVIDNWSWLEPYLAPRAA